MGKRLRHSVSDVENFVVIRMLHDSIFNTLPQFPRLWEIQIKLHEIFQHLPTQLSRTLVPRVDLRIILFISNLLCGGTPLVQPQLPQ
jgi:hypothetical protein